jgi:hypothetical protein
VRTSHLRRGFAFVFTAGAALLTAACNLAPDDPGPGETPRPVVTGYPTAPPSSTMAGGQPWWPYVIFGAIILVLVVIGVALATAPKRRRPPREAKK